MTKAKDSRAGSEATVPGAGDEGYLFVKELRDELGEGLRAATRGEGGDQVLYCREDVDASDVRSTAASVAAIARDQLENDAPGVPMESILVHSKGLLTFYYTEPGADEWFVTMESRVDVDVGLLESTCRKHT
jgi:hypothetical protein